MPWHPPIPAGLATSPDIHALQYKTAVLLLLYCYDGVGRDGRVTVSLKEAAAELQEPYETIRRWWRELRAGPFFCEQIDRGRIGWTVKFSDDWIDWHVLSNNFQRSPMNGKEVSIGSSIDFDRSPMNVETPAYKVLSTSDQARESEDQDRTRRTLSHPAVAAYYAAFPHIRLNQKQEAIISELVGEGVERLECWQEVISDYELSTIWKPENIGNMRSRFDRKLEEKKQKKQKKPDARPPLPVYQAPTDRPDPQAAAKAIVQAMKKANSDERPT